MTTQATNEQLILRARPKHAVRDDTFELITTPVDEPGPGQVLVRSLWLSFDATQRGWLNDIPSYLPPVEIGDVMRAWEWGR